MSIRYKLLLFFLIQHFVFLVAALLLAEFFIRPHYLKIEHRIATERLSQIKSVFESELEHLSVLTSDWAMSDEMYDYTQEGDEDFIKSHFRPEVLNTLDLNRIEIFDTSMKSLHALSNTDTEIKTLLEGLKWHERGINRPMKGMVSLGEKIAFISVVPILRSDRTGPVAGRLLMLRLVNESMIEKIDQNTNAKNSLHPKEKACVFDHSQVLTEVIDKKKLRGTIFLQGLDKKDSVVLESVIKRELAQESEELILFLFIFGGVLGFISFFISIYLLKRSVVSPLRQLGKHMITIRRDEEYIQSSLENRSDEIGLLAKAFNNLIVSIRSKNDTLGLVARVDALTGLSNRMDMEERFESERKDSCRDAVEMSVLMLDVDYFKKYNDSYGHVKGDEVLVAVAEAIKSACARPKDYIARYGGEEFIVVLPRTHVAGATIVAKRIRQAVEALAIEHKTSLLDKKTVSVSIGCVTTIARKGDSQDYIINMADEALYMAKESGRDRYYVYNRKKA